MYIDGDIWVADGGKIVRFVDGKSEGWRPAPARPATTLAARRAPALPR